MAFLADPEAMHPAYVRSFIFDSINDVPALIKQALRTPLLPGFCWLRALLITLLSKEKLLPKYRIPVSSVEAIGGTGDTLAAIVFALIASGRDVAEAAIVAAKANRLMGALANPNLRPRFGRCLGSFQRRLKLLRRRRL
jgi:hypothetical protein